MKITAVRVLRLSGTMPTEGPLWEERLVRPIDVYPEYRMRDGFEGGTDAGRLRVRSATRPSARAYKNSRDEPTAHPFGRAPSMFCRRFFRRAAHGQ